MKVRYHHWSKLLPKQEPTHTLSRRTDVATLCCSLLAVICWALLANWYALPVYAATPGFSFDRIPGHLHAPVLRATALLLVALSLIYGAGYWLIRQAPSLSRGIKLATILAIA